MDSISYRYSLVRSENVICPTSTPPVFENIALYTSITLSFLITWVPPGMGLIFLSATNVSSPHKRNLHSGASMLASMFTKGVGWASYIIVTAMLPIQQITSLTKEMSKTGRRSSPQTGKWESKEIRASQGRKNHSTVNPAPVKGMEKTDQAERRSCLAER